MSRERIVQAAIELLDQSGESGLTFRSLSERLATGPGAIYWHIADKGDLLIAACDTIVARVVNEQGAESSPQADIRNLALAIFDAMEAHPWLGSVFRIAAGKPPMARILEALGRQVQVLGIPEGERSAALSALMSYILGVAGQHAANTQYARKHGIDRAEFLQEVARCWEALDPQDYPVTRALASRVVAHDDRADFLAGIDLILRGIKSLAEKIIYEHIEHALLESGTSEKSSRQLREVMQMLKRYVD